METTETDILELLIDAPDGAYAVDMAQNIVFWNASAERILGRSAEEVVGSPCYKVLAGISEEDGRPVCTRDCHGILSARVGSVAPTHTALVHAGSDSRKWVSTTHILIPGHRPDLNTLVHLFHDVSDEVESRRFLRQLRDMITRETLDSAASMTAEGAVVLDVLSPRERDVLNLLAQGLGTEAIAKKLVVTPTTVRNHIQRILAKLGVHSRLEAVVAALRHSVR